MTGITFNNTEMLSISAVAKQLHTTELNVLMHIKRNKLHGEEVDGKWYVTAPSLEAFLTLNGGKANDLCSSGCAQKHACGGSCE